MHNVLSILKSLLKRILELFGLIERKTEQARLWTNPAPNSSFNGQSIKANGLSNYDEYEIKFKFHSTLTLVSTHKSIVGYGTLMSINDSGDTYRRNVTASGDTLTFSDQACSRSPSTDNAYMIPIAVDGIKLGGGYFVTLLRRLSRGGVCYA